MRYNILCLLVAISSVVVILGAPTTGFGVGRTPVSHVAADVAVNPIGPIQVVTNSGNCPIWAPFLYCNETGPAPVVGTASWTGESNLANAAQAAPWPGNYIGSQSVAGGFVTGAAVLAAGGHVATARWSDSEAWSGLVSVYNSPGCLIKYSDVYLNLTTRVEVINAAGVVVAAGVNTIPLDHKLVTTPVNGCTAHLYFSGSGGPNQAVAVPFVVPAGAYNMITTIAIVSTVLFTQDSCAVLGVDWGMPAPWTWTHNPTCPPLLAPPALPPTGANTGMVLLSATIV